MNCIYGVTVIRKARVDLNQRAIVKQLRAIGCSVLHLHAVGDGCPDICVGYRGRNYLLEIKNGAGKLTDKQVEFFKEWRGAAYIVRTFEQAQEVIIDN